MGEIISLDNRLKEIYYKEIFNIIEILKDYEIEVKIPEENIKIILDELYNLYKEKEISYEYIEDMLSYFNEICKDAAAEGISLTSKIIFNGLVICHRMMSPVEIEKKDILSALEKAKARIKVEEKHNEKRKCYKKLWFVWRQCNW